MFLAVSFLFAFFRIWGCDPRLIFPVAKVGLTALLRLWLDPPGLQSTFHKFFTLQDPRIYRRWLVITFAIALSQFSQLLQRKN